MDKLQQAGTFKIESSQGFFLFPVFLFCVLSLLLSASVIAAEPVFHFSSGTEGTEPDGSAYREMTLMNRGEAVPVSAVEMEEVWGQYYFRQANAKPEDIRRGATHFVTAVHKITPVVKDGTWSVRFVSPIAGTCTVLARFRYHEQSYIVQKQFNLYGRSWNAKEWQEDMTRQNAFTRELPLPYLSFGPLRNFYTGQELTGQYKNRQPASLAEENNGPVTVFNDLQGEAVSVVSTTDGKFSYQIPLAGPLQASIWRKAQQRIFMVPVPQGKEMVPLFTEIEFRDNYFAYDNIPYGALVMGLFTVLTAMTILIWRRRSHNHGY